MLGQCEAAAAASGGGGLTADDMAWSVVKLLQSNQAGEEVRGRWGEGEQGREKGDQRSLLGMTVAMKNIPGELCFDGLGMRALGRML